MQGLLFAIGFVLFVGLVIVHEWGHYKAARRAGVDVEEFGLGLPPRAKGRKLKSGMILSLNWLPLGGFVKMKGEHDNDKTKGSFGAASLGNKSRILLAGVFMNLVVGFAMLVILALIGMPKLIDNQFHVASDTKITNQQLLVGYIEPGSPADKAKLSGTDVIKSLSGGGQTFYPLTSEQLRTATSALAGRQVTLTIVHKGQSSLKQVTLRSKAEVEAAKAAGQPAGFLGISPNELSAYRATWSAPIVALGFTKQLVVLTIEGLGHALSGLGSTISGVATGNTVARQNGQERATAEVGGPVAIGALLWNGGSLGFAFMLMIIAVISLTLALMNILPIPALDGGRLAMILVSRGLFRRPLNKKTEEWAVGVSMLALIVLFALITVVDVKRYL